MGKLDMSKQVQKKSSLPINKPIPKEKTPLPARRLRSDETYS